MQLVEKALFAMARLLAGFGAVALTLMMLHICLDIASRYLLGHAINGTNDITAHYYMVALIFLPLALMEKEGSHISADILFGHLPERMQSAVTTLIALAMFAVLALLTWQFAIQAQTMTRVGEVSMSVSIRIPIWPTRWFLVVGTGLASAYALLLAVKNLLATWNAWTGGVRE